MAGYEPRRPLPISVQGQEQQRVGCPYGTSATTNTPCFAVVGVLPVTRPQTSSSPKKGSSLAESQPTSPASAGWLNCRARSSRQPPRNYSKDRKDKPHKNVSRNLWETLPLAPWG
eukprot:Tamp_36789.p3 GENE.Tamp_36789~~Tamp_36789.p3  ORF type:complete len:115 (-),score=8.13 Tamp_36789:30-374(-)